VFKLKIYQASSIFLGQKYHLDPSVGSDSFEGLEISDLHGSFAAENISSLSHQLG